MSAPSITVLWNNKNNKINALYAWNGCCKIV